MRTLYFHVEKFQTVKRFFPEMGLHGYRKIPDFYADFRSEGIIQKKKNPVKLFLENKEFTHVTRKNVFWV